MADTGWKFPGTTDGSFFLDASPWVNPDNVKADDGSNTTNSTAITDALDWFRASNFDFSSIPSGATIDGFEIRVGDYLVDTVSGTPSWTLLNLVDQNATLTGISLHGSLSAHTTSVQTGDVFNTQIGWDTNLNRAVVQDIDFGFVLTAKLVSAVATNFELDFLQMRVFYHEGVPTIIPSAVGVPGYQSPFKSSADNYYTVVRDIPLRDEHLDVYKTADPTTDTWVRQAAAGPVHAGTSVEGFSCTQAGDVIHIIAWSNASYEYYTFNMATDLWAIDESMEAPTNAPTFMWASIAVRSDGDVVVAYAGDTDQVMGGKKERVDYNVRTGGTWGGAQALDAAGDIHYGNPNCVLGTNDFVHCIWQRRTNIADPPSAWDNTQGRTISPITDNASTVDDNTASSGQAVLGIQHIISYDDVGTQRIIVPAFRESTTSMQTARGIEDGSDNLLLDATRINTTHTGGSVFTVGEANPVTFAELDGDIYGLYSGGGAGGVDQDLWYIKSTDDGSTWTLPVEELDGVTVNSVSASIYSKGTRLVTDWKFPGTMVGNRAIVGSDADWVNADNAKLDDGVLTTVDLVNNLDISSGLAAQNFDFSVIPVGSKIEGIEVKVEGYFLSATLMSFIDCKLINAAGVDGAEDKNTELTAPTTSPQESIAGSPTDLWQEDWTSADILDIDFGFFIGVNTNATRTFSVDSMQMRVHYTVPPIVIGYVYEDNGIMKYGEKTLVEALVDNFPYHVIEQRLREMKTLLTI